MGPFAHLM
jgi:ABC-type multidrug transport system permease subunit